MSAVSSVPPSRTKTLSHSCYCPPPPSLLVHCQERRPMHQSCAEDAGAHREEHMLLQRTIHLRTFVSVHNVACMSFGGGTRTVDGPSCKGQGLRASRDASGSTRTHRRRSIPRVQQRIVAAPLRARAGMPDRRRSKAERPGPAPTSA